MQSDVQWFPRSSAIASAMPHPANFMLQFYSGYSTESAKDLTIISYRAVGLRRISGRLTLPDLIPPDFLLWGYIKYRVYVNKPRDVSELKDALPRLFVE